MTRWIYRFVHSTFRGTKGIAGLAILLTAAGCAPSQWGSNQVPNVNANITEPKDAGSLPMPPDVDVVMANFLAATGDFSGKKKIPGCAIGIMEDNEVTRLKGYGLADVGANRPFTYFTPSVIGSVSKTWTALAALRLVELGLLDLEDTVGDYLPNAPASWLPMTIRKLLSHRTGLAYMPTFNPAIDTEAELSEYWFGNGNIIPQLGIHPKTVWVSYTQTPVTAFDPGESARYSNTGFMLVGAIIDEIVAANPDVVGDDFTTYERIVWRQVGMFDGNINNGDQMTSPALNEYWRQTDIPNLAKGYEYDPNGDSFDEVNFGNSDLLSMGPAGWEGPAGGWTVTIGDLTRLMAAIQNNDIISQATRDNEMLQVYGSDGGGNWGLGVNRTTKLNRPVYLHDGKYPGYRARYTVWPNESFGVAIMCNEDDADIKLVVDDIAQIFFDQGAGGVAPGGVGGNFAGFGPVVQARVLPQVDEDDPAYQQTFGRDELPPEIGTRERMRIARDLRHERHVQLVAARRHERIAKVTDHLGCPILLESLVDRHGLTALEPLPQCSAEPKNFNACIAHRSRDLERQGLFDKRTRARIIACAAHVDTNELKRLVEGD
jgi:CubicO group peptidase (beta-lactamase class C family)